MTQKLKLSDYQLKRIQDSIKILLGSDETIEEDIDISKLYEISSENKLFERFKNLFKYSMFKTIDSKLVMCILLEFDIKEKDSIKVNEEISKSVDFLEKIFIYLDNLKIIRISHSSQHYVIIKIVKNEIPDHLITN